MSFLTGSMKEMVPADIKAFRDKMTGFIGQQGLESAMPSTTDLSPFREAFAKTRAGALAQAKESSGNLTGSGYANTMGAAAGRSIFDENAFLAQLMEQSRQANASRFMSMVGQVPGLQGQMGYQPGFLDYVMQGAQAAAPAIANMVAPGSGALVGAAVAGRRGGTPGGSSGGWFPDAGTGPPLMPTAPAVPQMPWWQYGLAPGRF